MTIRRGPIESYPMSTKPTRPLTVSDALVLVAATAAGLTLLRSYPFLAEQSTEFLRAENGWSPRRLAALSAFVLSLLQFVLAPWTLALLALHLRRPRPPLRRLVIRPGAVACLAAAAGMVPALLGLPAKLACLRLLTGNWSWATSDDMWNNYISKLSPNISIYNTVVLSPGIVAFCILLAWGLLALGRRGRPERSWLDQSGRALGMLWLAAALGGWYLDEVEYWIRSNAPAPPPASSPPPPPPSPT
jgi:hypothetical protein